MEIVLLAVFLWAADIVEPETAQIIAVGGIIIEFDQRLHTKSDAPTAQFTYKHQAF